MQEPRNPQGSNNREVGQGDQARILDGTNEMPCTHLYYDEERGVHDQNSLAEMYVAGALLLEDDDFRLDMLMGDVHLRRIMFNLKVEEWSERIVEWHAEHLGALGAREASQSKLDLVIRMLSNKKAQLEESALATIRHTQVAKTLWIGSCYLLDPLFLPFPTGVEASAQSLAEHQRWHRGAPEGSQVLGLPREAPCDLRDVYSMTGAGLKDEYPFWAEARKGNRGRVRSAAISTCFMFHLRLVNHPDGRQLVEVKPNEIGPHWLLVIFTCEDCKPCVFRREAADVIECGQLSLQGFKSEDQQSHSDTTSESQTSPGVSTDKGKNIAVLAGVVAVVAGIWWYARSNSKEKEQHA
eukprot:Gb_40686 [translate_table: standard]